MIANTATTTEKPPDLPSEYDRESLMSKYYLPNWVMPMIYHIMQGYGTRDVVNGISVDTKGDLLLYRKVSGADVIMWPQLVGVEEVWLQVRIPEGNVV